MICSDLILAIDAGEILRVYKKIIDQTTKIFDNIKGIVVATPGPFDYINC